MIKPTQQDAEKFLHEKGYKLTVLAHGACEVQRLTGNDPFRRRKRYNSLRNAIVYTGNGTERDAEAVFEKWLIKQRTDC